MKKFRSYELALEFHKAVASLTLPAYLKSQLTRAAASIVCNLKEGSGRRTSRPTAIGDRWQIKAPASI